MAVLENIHVLCSVGTLFYLTTVVGHFSSAGFSYENVDVFVGSRASASRREVFLAPSLNVLTKKPNIHYSSVELKRVDPDSGRTGVAANAAPHAVTQNVLSEE